MLVNLAAIGTFTNLMGNFDHLDKSEISYFCSAIFNEKMTTMKKYMLTWLLSLLPLIGMQAQITGIVEDKNGDALPGVSVVYKGHNLSTITNKDGRFSILRHNGWDLTVSFVGFRSEVIHVNFDMKSPVRVVLRANDTMLKEVVVKKKRKSRYSRKNNPAVELMRRVIAAKKKTDLKTCDFYSYDKYQKITLSLNGLNEEKMDSGLFARYPWLKEHVEKDEQTEMLTMPLNVNETASRLIYRKTPKSEKEIITGRRSSGINDLMQTGDMINVAIKDVFTDVDIYDDQVRLLQYPFTSPIGSGAIAFYRYYIEDTVMVDNNRCYHLEFTPNNQQDFGFRGSLYIVADSTLQVKRCELTVPKSSNVNYVSGMHIVLQYHQLKDGRWVLDSDDMDVDLGLRKDKAGRFLVRRNTRRENYVFAPIANKLFKPKANVITEPDANLRDEAFWQNNRAVALSPSEETMGNMVKQIRRQSHFGVIKVGLQALLENYIETSGKDIKSKFDIGPFTTIASYNFVDHLRLQLGGKTTAYLHPHLFWKGYYAYGTHSRKSYYSTEVTYSLNKKKYSTFEYPMRNFVFESTRDVMSPADKILTHNKDNFMMSWRTQKVEQMYFYNRQKLSFVYETDWGFRMDASLKTESNRPTGQLVFKRMPEATLFSQEPIIQRIRTTELHAEISYSPGQTYVNSKQRRTSVNLDAPEFKIAHTIGLKGLLGSNYRMNFTEASVYKRQWLGSWGSIDMHLMAGAQWNKVPFPLLCMPPTNLNYLAEKQELETAFNLMRNMEFLNDRYAFWSVAWDMNGKIFNRIPLLHKLHWREFFCFKGMFGRLTDKNNPLLAQNAADNLLMQLPEGTHVMDSKKPYMELMAGVHNIFNLFAVDYVYRLNYSTNENVKRHGVRFSIMLSF